MAMRAAAEMRAAAAVPCCLRRLFSRTYSVDQPYFSVNHPCCRRGTAPKPSNKLRVDGLNKHTTARGLVEVYQKFGQVVNARVVTDPSSGYLERYGYVTYATVEDATKGKEGANGTILDGWVIYADYSQPRPPRKNKGAEQSGYNVNQPCFRSRTEPKPSNKLRVNGLNKHTTSRGLVEVFQKFGQVVNARVVTDPRLGYLERYGYVTYATVEDAIKGKEGVNGTFLDGWVIFTEYSQPRPPRKNNEAQQSGYSVNQPCFRSRTEPKPSNKLRVDGLNKHTTSRGLLEVFQKFGQVDNARVVTDPKSGYRQRYGYVRYATVEDAIKGKEGGDGTFLDGWVIFTEYSQPRPPRKSKGAQLSGQNNGTPPDGHQ